MRRQDPGATPGKIRFWGPSSLPQPQEGKTTQRRRAQKGLWTAALPAASLLFQKSAKGVTWEAAPGGRTAFRKEPCGGRSQTRL